MPSESCDRDWPLEHYRDYLHLLSPIGLGARLRALDDSSDVVQQTLMKAQERIGQFRGTGEAEFLAWLRAILARQLADLARRSGQPRGRRGSRWRRPWSSRRPAWRRGWPTSSPPPARRPSTGSNSSAWPRHWPGCPRTSGRPWSCTTWRATRCRRSAGGWAAAPGRWPGCCTAG
jgi:hypothetical protein